MLISMDNGKRVTSLPHKGDYNRWRSRLSDSNYAKMEDAINAAIGDGDVCTAGWIPGHDWTDTPYEPLYYACGQNAKQSALFFGLIVFDILMRRENRAWGFGRYEKDGIPIASMTYFAVDWPPKT